MAVKPFCPDNFNILNYFDIAFEKSVYSPFLFDDFQKREMLF